MNTHEYIAFLEKTITQQKEQLENDWRKYYLDGYKICSKIRDAQKTEMLNQIKKPLTNDELKTIARQCQFIYGINEHEYMSYDVLFGYAREIEKAHGIV